MQRIKVEAQQAMIEKTIEKVAYKVVNDVFKAMNKKQPKGKK